MIELHSASPAAALEDRLTRGLELLFDMEQRGEMDREYRVWLRRWLDILDQYEALDRA